MLSICPTPLGNLGDITVRTLEVLRAADAVCAEDTRVTGRLLAAYGIEKRIERLDEHTLKTKTPQIIERVLAGERIAYCSDAGMPGISDPGMCLVAAARAAKAAVEVLPGPSAVTAAYVASGFSSQNFYFGGFFPRKEGARDALLDTLRHLDAALVFYESPHRIAGALAALARAYPYRQVAVCRELTKLHEEVVCAPTGEAARIFAQRERQGAVKGEIVIVVDAPAGAERASEAHDAKAGAQARADELKQAGGHSRKDIVAILQKEYGIARNAAYDIVVGR